MVITERKQQLFDRVVTHLLQQGQPCMKDHVCVYRNSGGLSCAIGSLIDDKHYSPSLENTCLESHGPVYKAVCASLGYTLSDAEEVMLGNLRSIHDEVNPMRWPTALKELARVEGLTFSA